MSLNDFTERKQIEFLANERERLEQRLQAAEKVCVAAKDVKAACAIANGKDFQVVIKAESYVTIRYLAEQVAAWERLRAEGGT